MSISAVHSDNDELRRLASLPPVPLRVSSVVGLAWQCAAVAACLIAAPIAVAKADDPPTRHRIAFVGLHGGIFPALQELNTFDDLELVYWSDDAIAASSVPPGPYRVVLIQHVRGESRKALEQLVRDAVAGGATHVISISGLAEKHLTDLAKDGTLRSDPKLRAYYGTSRTNLARMLAYIRVNYLGLPGSVPPPETTDIRGKIYHPDHEGLFDDAEAFLKWAANRTQGPRLDAPRVVVAVHSTHLTFQQPLVVAALIRALEKQGLLAAAVVDLNPAYERAVAALSPQVVLHTCHSRESVRFRETIGVPHVQSVFVRSPAINEWRTSVTGLSASDLAFQLTSQELLGAIEPLVGSGVDSVGAARDFQPIPDRIEHIARRVAGWCRLATRSDAEKRIAIIYYDREAGKGELMRGSATGMFLNAPRSVLELLRHLRRAGFKVEDLPATEEALLERLQDHGRLIGPWNARLLEPLARSGHAALVPVETYRRWLEERVPEAQRQRLIETWGEPPGKFMVWRDGEQAYFVIPKVTLGNIILLPQPLRGEAFDTSKLHDLRVPPPHNYIATYFWLEETFGADALIHFGTHGSEFLLPGKPTGLSRSDWPDILMGGMPNIQPWVINNLGESSPVRRRAYALLVDHLVPPSVAAELSDELANLHADIDKWMTLPDGALKEAFRSRIAQQVRDQHLAQDLGWPELPRDAQLSDAQIQELLAYLHDLHNETIPVSLHILGTPPPLDLQVPWIVTCLRRRFLEELDEVIEVPPEESLTEGDRLKYLRARAEDLVNQMLRNGLGPLEALQSVGASKVTDLEKLSDALRRDLEQIPRLYKGFEGTGAEIERIREALQGRFIPPGPGNGPDRNPSVLPTGRNMYLMNPEEVPSQPSWEVGVRLVDQMLDQYQRDHGRYPRRVAFSLNAFATFQDYGVMESQILYLLGVRPVWDTNQRVRDLELIPRAELGRPRIDVFISVLGYYRDMLPSRMKLLDQAVRLVAAAKEESDNAVRENTQRIAGKLAERGLDAALADELALARIFGAPPGQVGSAGYYYLIERSGEWDTREELMDAYLSFARHAYTGSQWGTAAPETYDLQIQGCDVLLRSWSDRTRSPLSNKYVWYKGGSLSAAIAHLTGKEPQWFLSDVRDPDTARLIEAKDALRRDFRVRLFNRKWIEGMMKEGYAGADQIAVHVSNTYGWKIMREKSVTDDVWEEIVDVYLRDKKNLHVRSWFESVNPFAYQEVTEILLEVMRKGYWSADEATRVEVARAYVESVLEHGEGGGLRGGGNEKLRQFVLETLRAAPDQADRKLAEAFERAPGERDGQVAESAAPSAPSKVADAKGSVSETVEGPKLERRDSTPAPRPASRRSWWLIGSLVVAGLLLVAGYRWGHRH